MVGRLRTITERYPQCRGVQDTGTSHPRSRHRFDAVARIMGAGADSYADGDLALAVTVEKEAQDAAKAYAESKTDKDRRRG